MSTPVQLCSVCDAPVVNTKDMPCGALVSSPLYSGEGNKVVLCSGCFGRCLSGLRRERLVHTMFDDVQEELDNFGQTSPRDES